MSIPLSLDAAGLVRSRLGKFLVIAAGALGIGAVVWWFLIRKETTGTFLTGEQAVIEAQRVHNELVLATAERGPQLVATGPLAGKTVDVVTGTSVGLGPGPVLVTVDPVTKAVTGVVSPGLLVGR